MTGAHHAIAAQGPDTAACACGLEGAIPLVTAHVARYGTLQTASVKVGRIRAGQLTREAERTHFELEDLDGRAFVLFVGTAADTPAGVVRKAASSLETLSGGIKDRAAEGSDNG